MSELVQGRPATDAQVIVETAQQAVAPDRVDPGGLYSIVVPAGARRELLDLEQYLPEPERKHGQVTLFTAASLAAYVNVHKDQGTSLFADDRAARVVAVLNGHHESGAGWGDHLAVLQLRTTPEWDRWVRRNGAMLSQADFAEHIQDGLVEIVEPPAADMLELAQSFQAAVKVVFKEARQISSGQRQLTYEETIDAKAGEKGAITISREFVIGVKPYEGGEAYRVTARLKYRISDGRLSIGYALDRAHDVLRSAFADVVTSVQEATELTAYLGTPPC